MDRLGIVFLIALLLTTAATGLVVGGVIAGLRGDATWLDATLALGAAPFGIAGLVVLGRIVVVTKQLAAAEARAPAGKERPDA